MADPFPFMASQRQEAPSPALMEPRRRQELARAGTHRPRDRPRPRRSAGRPSPGDDAKKDSNGTSEPDQFRPQGGENVCLPRVTAAATGAPTEEPAETQAAHTAIRPFSLMSFQSGSSERVVFSYAGEYFDFYPRLPSNGRGCDSVVSNDASFRVGKVPR